MISESGPLRGSGDYEIFPKHAKIGYVFGVQTASGARVCEISLK